MLQHRGASLSTACTSGLSVCQNLFINGRYPKLGQNGDSSGGLFLQKLLKRGCSVVIAAYLSYCVHLASFACCSSYLFWLYIYCSLHRLSLSPLSRSPSICYHETVNNLQTTFGGSVICTVHCLCNGSPYEPYLENQ